MKITAETFEAAIQEFGIKDPVALLEWYQNTGHTQEDLTELRAYVLDGIARIFDAIPDDQLVLLALASMVIVSFRVGVLSGMAEASVSPDFPEDV